MSAIFMDGFDHYGSGISGAGYMLEGAWAQTQGDALRGPGIPSWGSRTGTYALTGNGRGTGEYRYVLPATEDVVFLSMGFSVDGLPSVDYKNEICSFRDASNVELCSLWVQASGAITLTDENGAPLITTQGPVITSRTWHFCEMKINTTTGTFTLRVDDAGASETPILNKTGISFASPVGQITVLSGNSGVGGVTSWCDDLFIRNDSGTVNNTWLGDRRVATLLANADTTTAGWSANRYTKLGAGILDITSTTSTGAAVGAASSTSLNIGSGDFTLESFVRFKALPTSTNKATIFSRWDQLSDQRSYQLFLGSTALNNGSLCFQTSTDGTNSTITQSVVYPWTPDLDTWYHVAIVRASNELLLFVDGQQFGLPIADSTTYFAGTAGFSLGGELHASTPVSGANLTGWMDETRFTNGFARYTSNFTPPVVEFPRGVSDPHWANVALLAGYDTVIQDESGYARALTAFNGAVQFTPHDGADIGTYPVIGKAAPDDNTFVEAPFTNATSILTVTVLPSDGNTARVGTKDGSTAATYRFKTALAAAFDVLIDVSIEATLQNLYNAINAGPGSGTKYHAGTTANFDVSASQLPAGQMQVTALTAGTAGNAIVTTVSGLTGAWTGGTLAGGLNIPGPSNFQVQRLPANTTLISAIQVTMRSFKSDSGVGTINSAFVGPLGGVTTTASHALTVTPVYYNDIYEIDPDTSGPLSPTSIINGAIQINRDT